MKNIREHMAADMLLLGYTDPAIHTFLDSGVKFFGPAHRLDKHDFRTVKMLDENYGEEIGNVALLHLFLDFHILDDKLVMNIIKEKK